MLELQEEPVISLDKAEKLLGQIMQAPQVFMGVTEEEMELQ